MLFGFFLTQVYYRSSNWMKVAVSCGIVRICKNLEPAVAVPRSGTGALVCKRRPALLSLFCRAERHIRWRSLAFDPARLCKKGLSLLFQLKAEEKKCCVISTGKRVCSTGERTQRRFTIL